MDAHYFQFRDTNKLHLLPFNLQNLLIRLLRYLSYFLFGLSVFVIIWLFLFAFAKKPDSIECHTINAYYSGFDESINHNLNFRYYDLIKRNDSFLNQKIKCLMVRPDSWSCLEIYAHNSSLIGKVIVIKESMTYFDMTEYLSNQHAKAFQNNLILSCMMHFKSIDKLFVCIFEITCKYKLFAVLHFVLLEILINWFVMSTIRKDFIPIRNGFINSRNNFSHNHKILRILRYCQSVLILTNGLCYVLYGIVPLCLPFAYLIINYLQKDRLYVEFVNIIIIALKYLLFVLKSTKFYVNE